MEDQGLKSRLIWLFVNEGATYLFVLPFLLMILVMGLLNFLIFVLGIIVFSIAGFVLLANFAPNLLRMKDG